MPTIHPLGLAKDVTGTATHIARGAVGLGLRAAGAVGEQVFRRASDVARRAGTAIDPTPSQEPPEPVNVVEELDLDPAPVDEPVASSDAPEPVTGIDAQADPDTVDVTPADVAEQVERGHRRGS